MAQPKARGEWADKIIIDKRMNIIMMVVIVILWPGRPSLEFKVLRAITTLGRKS